jgi:hypothetical protein
MKRSYWGAIGCRRGTLDTEMANIILCPEASNAAYLSKKEVQAAALSCAIPEYEISTREKDIETLIYLMETATRMPTMGAQAGISLEEVLKNTWASCAQLLPLLQTSSTFHAFRTPLNECILAVIWELERMPTCSFNSAPLTFERFIVLLISAARYQASLDRVGSFQPL